MLKKKNLLEMAEVRDKWCVSMYMPINQVEPEKNRIRLKNLWSAAEKKLLELEMNPSEASRMLNPLEMIFDHSDFWKKSKGSLAAFFTKESFVWYSLPPQLKELVVVTDRFHLKPLFRNSAESKSFYLLTLSQNRITFFEANEFGINQIFLKGMPQSVTFDLENERKPLQMHSGGKGSPIFHGQGGASEDQKGKILEVFRQVNKAVTNFLKTEDLPLLLAGVDFLHPIYRKANTYPHLVKDGIIGNVEALKPEQLLEKAMPFVKLIFRREREMAIKVFQEKLGTGLASEDFIEVFKAVLNGRIDTLFVPVGKQKWGTFDSSKNEIKINKMAKPGDYDLFCMASTKTLLKGGKVFAVRPEQMPNKTSVAAIMRY